MHISLTLIRLLVIVSLSILYYRLNAADALLPQAMNMIIINSKETTAMMTVSGWTLS